MEKQSQSTRAALGDIVNDVKKLGSLYITKARLASAEKMTILLSSIAFASVLIAVGLILMVFISIGIGHLLASTVEPHMAYLTVAAFYLVLMIVLIFLRRKLFIDPIARFMSRLLIEPPVPSSEEDSADAQDAPRSGTNGQQVNIEIDYDILAKHVIDMLEKDAKNNKVQEGGVEL